MQAAYITTAQEGENMGKLELLLYLIATIAGALGGCAAASHRLLRQGDDKFWMYLLAYSIIGTFFGVLSFAGHATIGTPYAGIHEATLFSLVYGFGGAVALAATNLSVKFILKRLGIEIDVRVTKVR